MADELKDLINTVNNVKREIQIRKDNYLKFDVKDPSLLEFIELILNDCDKIILEINQTIESTKGIRGVFSGKKKKIIAINEKINKCKENVLENESKVLNSYLNLIIDLEEKYRTILNNFALLREEMRKKEIVWQSVSEAMNKLITIRDSFGPLKDQIFNLKDQREADTDSFFEITRVLLELKDSLNELEERNVELEKKVGFRNIVLAKINTAITKNEEIMNELTQKLNLNLVEFFDKIFEETVSESTDDDYLEEIMPLLDSIGESAGNISEMIISYESTGIPLSAIINQSDIKGALSLLKIIITQFKNEYKEYIEQEYSFTEKLKDISKEISPILRSISDYIGRLDENYEWFKKFINGIITSWFQRSKEKGGWKAIKKQYLALENFLLNHYPSIGECIDMRIKGINPKTIKGVSMFQNCIPNEYKNEKFILDTILPGILYAEEIDIIENSLKSYGDRGWLKRGELKMISEEYIENYLNLKKEVRLININDFEIILSPKLIIKKIEDKSQEAIYNYFNKYIADKELCENISNAIKKIL